MLPYRQKILLATLEAFGGTTGNLLFQKYLFLFSQKMSKKYYHFIPYKYGCFSFESYNDKRKLINTGILENNESKWILSPSFKKNHEKGLLSEIKSEDRNCILDIKRDYEKLSQSKLLQKVYSEYPYYASKSTIIEKVKLSSEEIKRIKNSVLQSKKICLFTIGYEGRSQDEFLNTLIKNNVKALCDVRKNPVSRKWGFSKTSLSGSLKNLNIFYSHIPELGVDSYLRENLGTKESYSKLFDFYSKNILNMHKLNKIKDLINLKKRVALTCFEAQHDMCHRQCIALKMKEIKPEWSVKHL